MVRLATKNLLVSVDTVVGLELLATTFSDKHIASVLPNCVLVKPLQRLDSFVTYITGVKPLSLMCLVQQLHKFPQKPPLTSSGPGASR